MHIFNYDFIKTKTVTSNIFQLSNIIFDLKAKTDIKKQTQMNLFKSLETLAIKESVEASNAIEGIFTSGKRLTDLIEQNLAPQGKDEKDIAGYRDALRFITQNYEHLSFNEETILLLHKMVFSYQVEPSSGGNYKDTDNLICEKYSDGRIKRVIFKPVPAKETKEAMEQLCLAYQVASSDYEIPSLLLLPCVIQDFLCIHPFKDGNGRISRLLTTLLLYKAGFNIGKYISFENGINNYKDSYYEALEACSSSWHESNNTYIPFITFSFQILFECYKEMNKRFLYSNKDRSSKKLRIETLILESIVPISKQEINDFYPDISRTTIEAVLSSLLKQKKIYKIGTTKNAKYKKL